MRASRCAHVVLGLVSLQLGCAPTPKEAPPTLRAEDPTTPFPSVADDAQAALVSALAGIHAMRIDIWNIAGDGTTMHYSAQRRPMHGKLSMLAPCMMQLLGLEQGKPRFGAHYGRVVPQTPDGPRPIEGTVWRWNDAGFVLCDLEFVAAGRPGRCNAWRVDIPDYEQTPLAADCRLEGDALWVTIGDAYGTTITRTHGDAWAWAGDLATPVSSMTEACTVFGCGDDYFTRPPFFHRAPPRCGELHPVVRMQRSGRGPVFSTQNPDAPNEWLRHPDACLDGARRDDPSVLPAAVVPVATSTHAIAGQKTRLQFVFENQGHERHEVSLSDWGARLRTHRAGKALGPVDCSFAIIVPQPHRARVLLPPGGRLTIDADWIASEATGAGKACTTTPLPAGPHTVRLQFPGGVAAETTVEVHP
ncbi:MAG: hypothetical protein AAF721_09690 [Myxococcota bacterium]